jgi:hypothetical protein
MMSVGHLSIYLSLSVYVNQEKQLTLEICEPMRVENNLNRQ